MVVVTVPVTMPPLPVAAQSFGGGFWQDRRVQRCGDRTSSQSGQWLHLLKPRHLVPVSFGSCKRWGRVVLHMGKDPMGWMGS